MQLFLVQTKKIFRAKDMPEVLTNLKCTWVPMWFSLSVLPFQGLMGYSIRLLLVQAMKIFRAKDMPKVFANLKCAQVPYVVFSKCASISRSHGMF